MDDNGVCMGITGQMDIFSGRYHVPSPKSEERKDLKCVVVVVVVVVDIHPSVPIEFPRKFIITLQHFNLYLTSVFY